MLNQLRHYAPQKKEFHETMLSLISLNDPSDRGVLLRCANTLSYIHGLSRSYDTEAWKYYVINLRLSKLQQIFRPRIILLIQVHPKKVYCREIPTGLRQGSNPRRLRQLRVAIKRHLLNHLRHYAPQKRSFLLARRSCRSRRGFEP